MSAATRTIRCPNCRKNNRVPAVGQGVPECGNCHRPLPWIADADDAGFARIAEQATIPVLVDIWATWCGPCRMVSPALEKVATDLAGRIKLVKVDVDASPGLSRRFEVQAVPTLMVLDRGRVIARQAGAGPAPALRRWVDQALADRTSATAGSSGSADASHSSQPGGTP
ncbi:MAG TPA: thioredoxin [Actinospica sp.]|nr:thioredoxin [Actinospica sp.]